MLNDGLNNSLWNKFFHTSRLLAGFLLVKISCCYQLLLIVGVVYPNVRQKTKIGLCMLYATHIQNGQM